VSDIQRPRLIVSAMAMALIALCAEVRGHGGAYRGPIRGGPGGLGQGSGSPFPGGSTPRNPRAATTAATANVRRWETWWGFNKEEYLPLPRATTGRPSGRRYAPDEDRWDRDRIREQVIPILIKLASSSGDTDVRDSATLALARVGDVREFKLLARLTNDRERKVAESAVIGLGLLRTPRAEALLSDMATNPTRSARLRRLAVLALGFSGGEQARTFLLHGLGEPHRGPFARRGGAPELESVRAVAAGLVHGSDLAAGPARVAADPATGHILHAISMNRVDERAFLPMAYAALSKTRDSAALTGILRGLEHRTRAVRASAAIALGRVLHAPSPVMIKQLARKLQDEKHAYVRSMMIISLGRVGGARLKPVLMGQLDHKDKQHQAFAAIACAMAGYGEVRQRLRDGLLSARDASMKSAYAVAIAILGDRDAAEDLMTVIRRDGNPEVRAHLVEALTVLNARDAVPLMTELFVDCRSAHLKAACGQGIGLLGTPASRETLMLMLKSGTTSLTAKGGIATGLGRTGDHRAIPPLLAMARDASEQGLARGFAVTALGILCAVQPEPTPFARLAIDANYDVRIDILDSLRWLF